MAVSVLLHPERVAVLGRASNMRLIYLSSLVPAVSWMVQWYNNSGCTEVPSNTKPMSQATLCIQSISHAAKTKRGSNRSLLSATAATNLALMYMLVGFRVTMYNVHPNSATCLHGGI